MRVLSGFVALISLLIAGETAAQTGGYRDPLMGKEFEVVKLDKKRTSAIIDGGSGDGVQRGRTLCIFNREDAQIGCWPVSGVKASQSAITIPKAQFRSVKRGMMVRPAPLQPAPVPGGAYPQQAPRAGAAAAPGRTGLAFVTFGYAYVPLLPFNFDVPAFDVDARAAGGPLWKSSSTVKSSPAAIRFVVETPLTATVALSLGIVYRHINETKAQGDYDADDPAAFIEQQLTAQSIGVPLQARWLFGSGRLLFLLAEGLEIDYSLVRLRASSKRDDGTATQRIADLLSTLTVFSIRGDFAAVMRFSPTFSGQAGLALLIPVASGGSAEVTKLTLPAGASPTRDHEKDLVSAVGHRRSKVGIEIPITFSVTF